MNLIADTGATPFPRVTCEVASYSLFNVHGFPNIDDIASGIVKIIDAAFRRKLIKLFL